MKCLIGLGSNLKDRLDNLEQAARKIPGPLRASGVYETPALVPPGAPASWNIPFLNAAVECEWTGTPEDLLRHVKKIEAEMGRAAGERWAPRIIDLDILVFGDRTINSGDLTIPHSGLWERPFVLGPLRDIAPGLRVPGKNISVLARARELGIAMPQWMAILNLTPDSFSDGGELDGAEAFKARVEACEAAGASWLDLGAESTRPGAAPVEPDEEWRRLESPLAFLRARYKDRLFRPPISVDTRRAATAAKALAAGADCINDVSGGADPAMAGVVRGAGCDYIFMHSLSVPVDKAAVLPENCDPVAEVKAWGQRKIDALLKAGLAQDRLIFDPGIGFGKTAAQSLALLKGVEAFMDLPVRVMVGHSRKSFITHLWGDRPAAERDWESVGISLQMARRGADILRVHEAENHVRTYRAFKATA